ncbi:uncharacterized protein LOC124209470 [Daphnia pulex]|uniref:uncharacterized protein LOC124209470 n=1 Tax=Daphnia pulex TaxID=6669 RepID=UPI001EE13465|nr:uncharacterized protein LOC124209470 [Daphnia pulex]
MCSGSARVWEQLCSPGEPNSGLKVPRSPSDALSNSPSRPLDSGSDRFNRESPEQIIEMEDKWICLCCTLLNDATVEKCVACETEKGQKGNHSSTSSGEDSSKDFAEHYY